MGYTLTYETDFFGSEEDFATYNDAVTRFAKALQINKEKITEYKITENHKSGKELSELVLMKTPSGEWITPEEWQNKFPRGLPPEDVFATGLWKAPASYKFVPRTKDGFFFWNIRLATLEEAESLPEYIREFPSHWWLNDIGTGYEHISELTKYLDKDAHLIMYVSANGTIIKSGAVANSVLAVRPILITQNKLDSYKLYEQITINNTAWRKIGDHELLCDDTSFSDCAYIKDMSELDERNLYESSSIKQWIDQRAKELGFTSIFNSTPRAKTSFERRKTAKVVPIDMFG